MCSRCSASGGGGNDGGGNKGGGYALCYRNKEKLFGLKLFWLAALVASSAALAPIEGDAIGHHSEKVDAAALQATRSKLGARLQAKTAGLLIGTVDVPDSSRSHLATPM